MNSVCKCMYQKWRLQKKMMIYQQIKSNKIIFSNSDLKMDGHHAWAAEEWGCPTPTPCACIFIFIFQITSHPLLQGLLARDVCVHCGCKGPKETVK